ncbi:hypothetical protein KIN20_013268 [Parelaphostrongylus tenuis]|uniref:Homeobox domain-containing protein n=1 Tax=Parelaphostrongylus tenuis TaxID=148309 RepID=A0AAD5N1V9_PARTN|nr:hypothetical protein KIN20_013268 [Parelaphostrongylus tenuis]
MSEKRGFHVDELLSADIRSITSHDRNRPTNPNNTRRVHTAFTYEQLVALENKYKIPFNTSLLSMSAILHVTTT